MRTDIMMGLGAVALSLTIPAVAHADCTTTPSGFVYCADTATNVYDFYFSDSATYEDVWVTMKFNESTREVWFSFSVSRCAGVWSCSKDSGDSYTSPHMAMIVAGAEPADSDVVNPPFTATFHMGQGDDRIMGTTRITHADQTHEGKRYFPGKVLGQRGHDLINGFWDVDGGDGVDHIIGTPYDDFIKGGADGDTILARGGNDEVHGQNGRDFIYGEDGDDELYGDDGDDYMDGGTGDDALYGGRDADELYGGDDDDFLHGSYGPDKLYGGAGNDVLEGNDGQDRLYGGDGQDSLSGGANDDDLDGGSGSLDACVGGKGSDHLTACEL